MSRAADRVHRKVRPARHKAHRTVVKRKPTHRPTRHVPARTVRHKAAHKAAHHNAWAPRGVAAVLAYARAQLGKPYVWGADGPSGFDCSGLLVAAWRKAGVRLPHQTGDLVSRGHRVARAQLRPGDLVFPSSHHVGLYLGGGMMIHAPHTGDHVRIATVYAFYTARRL